MLITADYLAQQRALHASNEHYGTSGHQCAPLVRPLAAWGRKRILDYGCGRETLKQALGPAYHVTGYDPCVDGLDAPPEPHPVVTCTDVLEHIEPDCLDAVMQDLRRLTLEVGFWAVHLGPAKKVLADGRNAHLIQHPQEWWFDKAREHGFTLVKAGHGYGPKQEVVCVWIEVI
jgi:hypothetical protein